MRRLFVVLFLSGLSLAALGAARAQDRDIQPLLDRLDRLERDVNLLQRQVYQGAYQGSAPSGAPAAAGASGQSALGNELALSQLQEQMRGLNGQIEEINYNLNQLKTRLDKLSSDVDLRFSQLGGAPPSGPAASPPPDGTAPLRPPGRSGSLGSMPGGSPPGDRSANEPPPPVQQQAAAPATAGGGVLPSGTTQDQYNYAFGLLRRADYPSAEQALKSFVQRYPNDPLAGNAQYWLGETYFVRKDYKDAATAFAEGYQKYPKGAKAPDNLLKLGVTLAALGQKGDACKAFARLDRDFPSAPGNLKEQEATERQGAGC